VRRSVMRRCLKGLGGFPTSTDGFILGPSHGTVGRLELFLTSGAEAPVALDTLRGAEAPLFHGYASIPESCEPVKASSRSYDR
jgi:hypothetical protein